MFLSMILGFLNSYEKPVITLSTAFKSQHSKVIKNVVGVIEKVSNF